ncbi:methylase [Thozetella sp. PMI_491]|nr:methylase [Thozetella sp. PMI_491]
MTQNIYDDAEFLDAYRALKESGTKDGLIGGSISGEKLSRTLPSVAGLDILDLGCGDGWFSTWALHKGAASTHGIDISTSQLALAREATSCLDAGNKATWARGDLDTIVLPESAYDLVFSSLALHYTRKPKALFAKIARSLRPGGNLYFTVEHPIFTASPRRTACDGNGECQVHWPVANYFDEGDRLHFWLGKDVEKSHFTLETYMEGLLAAGLTLVHFHEWTRPNNGEFRGQKWWMSTDMGPSYLMIGVQKGGV